MALFDLMAGGMRRIRSYRWCRCATPKKRGAIHDAEAGDSAPPPPPPRLPSSPIALSSARRQRAARRGGSRHDRKITSSAKGATARSRTVVQRMPSSARRDARYRRVGRKIVASSDRRRCFGPGENGNRRRMPPRSVTILSFSSSSRRNSRPWWYTRSHELASAPR